MQPVSVIGYPRIGARRELKKWVEEYFQGKLTRTELLQNAAEIRRRHWMVQAEKGIDYIPSNDFSFYDTFLDTAYLLNVIPDDYRQLGLDDLDTYFAMAKGYQDATRDVKALPMKKWFNTNYHYLVPTLDANTRFSLNGNKLIEEYQQAAALGIQTKPVLVGAFTFLKLSKVNWGHKSYVDFIDEITAVYLKIIEECQQVGVTWLQLDEPTLVTDLDSVDKEVFTTIYQKLLHNKNNLKVVLQTYFGDLRDVYDRVVALNFDGIGLDMVEGVKNLELLEKQGFPEDKWLFAGVVNGKNIWRNDYEASLKILNTLGRYVDQDKIIISTSCSLMHVPYSVADETALAESYRKQLAFAEEKLNELKDLAELFNDPEAAANPKLRGNITLLREKRENQSACNVKLRERIAELKDSDFCRRPGFKERNQIQKNRLKLPKLPTTTIGSFPQTPEIRRFRKQYRDGKMTIEQYQAGIKEKIAEVIRLQEEIGLDVLVHGEFERNDMVEYFGQQLEGFLFTENGWVQSYGTRCVKPPIIYEDISRQNPMTVEYIAYAQSLTDKPVKGMLTGPVTILNWSFPREDLSLAEIAYQIALAIREEVLDLEAQGIKIIQVDEAALREKLPLRKTDWHHNYLDWAIRAFRLVHAGVKPETQIHTHMCYSEFEDIIAEIDAMDADVISFEAARSDWSLLDTLVAGKFRTEVGPGVYDIHSPRVPGKEELKANLQNIVAKLDPDKVWVNPDCGLKTRRPEETVASLKNMVAAARELRKSLEDNSGY